MWRLIVQRRPAPVLTSFAAMATTATSHRPLVSPAARDRKFYTGMAMVMLFTAVIGFSRTYFLGLISGHATTITRRVPNTTVHLHALLFMSWLVLFIVQTNLIATHRVKVHRKLGYFGVALAAAMIVVGGRTAVEAARLGAVPPGAKPWNFIAIPFGDITTFAIFVIGAVLWRNNKGEAQAADHPGLRLPDGGAPGALAGRPGPWSTVLLRPHAAVPNRRGGVRPMVTRARPPGVLVGLALLVLASPRASLCSAARLGRTPRSRCSASLHLPASWVITYVPIELSHHYNDLR